MSACGVKHDNEANSRTNGVGWSRFPGVTSWGPKESGRSDIGTVTTTTSRTWLIARGEQRS
eukprot:1846330-Rhodomonas_salina.1